MHRHSGYDSWHCNPHPLRLIFIVWFLDFLIVLQCLSFFLSVLIYLRKSVLTEIDLKANNACQVDYCVPNKACIWLVRPPDACNFWCDEKCMFWTLLQCHSAAILRHIVFLRFLFTSLYEHKIAGRTKRQCLLNLCFISAASHCLLTLPSALSNM